MASISVLPAFISMLAFSFIVVVQQAVSASGNQEAIEISLDPEEVTKYVDNIPACHKFLTSPEGKKAVEECIHDHEEFLFVLEDGGCKEFSQYIQRRMVEERDKWQKKNGGKKLRSKGSKKGGSNVVDKGDHVEVEVSFDQDKISKCVEADAPECPKFMTSKKAQVAMAECKNDHVEFVLVLKKGGCPTLAKYVQKRIKEVEEEFRREHGQ